MPAPTRDDPHGMAGRRPSLRLDRGLAEELAERLGVGADGTDAGRRLDGDRGQESSAGDDERRWLGELVAGMARTVPVGTLAKHAAAARGELPPGADADSCARAVLAGLDGDRPRPDSPSWTCWVHTTVCRALVESLLDRPARVVAGRNLDGRVPVDFHSMVEVDTAGGTGGGTTVVLDPLFAVGPIPVGGRARRDGWAGEVVVEADGRRATRWFDTPGGTDARYRIVTGALDADDVAAFLHLSTTHTGMSARRWWRLAGPTTAASITDDTDAGPLLKRYTRTPEGWVLNQRFVDRWTEATAAAIDHVRTR